MLSIGFEVKCQNVPLPLSPFPPIGGAGADVKILRVVGLALCVLGASGLMVCRLTEQVIFIGPGGVGHSRGGLFEVSYA